MFAHRVVEKRCRMKTRVNSVEKTEIGCVSESTKLGYVGSGPVGECIFEWLEIDRPVPGVVNAKGDNVKVISHFADRSFEYIGDMFRWVFERAASKRTEYDVAYSFFLERCEHVLYALRSLKILLVTERRLISQVQCRYTQLVEPEYIIVAEKLVSDVFKGAFLIDWARIFASTYTTARFLYIKVNFF